MAAKWLTKFLHRPWRPLAFPSTGFETFDEDMIIEEERYEAFKQGQYYPMNIGDVLLDTFQVVGKLGFGTSSTVWLARDMPYRKHVALKVYIRGDSHGGEVEMYRKIREKPSKHPGSFHVRSMLETVTIRRAGGNPRCLVQEPLWDSLDDLRRRRDPPVLSMELLKMTLVQLFKGLDFLHSECRLVHTDIKGDNISLALHDKTVIKHYIDKQLDEPCPRKITPQGTFYASQSIDIPKTSGQIVLGDLGEAVNGDEPRHHNAQPDFFRAPEIWPLFRNDVLFSSRDPDGGAYTTRAHLADLIGLRDQPPSDLRKRGRRVDEFFDDEGNFIADVPLSFNATLQAREKVRAGDDKAAFLRFMRRMLQWRPKDRATAAELLDDPWLRTE